MPMWPDENGTSGGRRNDTNNFSRLVQSLGMFGPSLLSL